MVRCMILMALLLATALAHGAERALDPAPPKVSKLKNVDLPKLTKHEGVIFHGRPKPLPDGAATHDWKMFLGPTYNGVSTETKLLKKFPDDGLKRVWELTKKSGYASPGIQGKYLVFPHRLRDEVIIECLHPETGESYWQHRYPTDYQDRYGYGNGPRSSPVMDGDRVYTLSVEGRLICLMLKTGQVLWQRNLNRDFGVRQDFFGTVTTPLLQGNTLIINVGAPGGPCVVGIDKMTGRVVWHAGKKWGPSYASPIPGVIHGKNRVLVFAGGDSEPPTGGLMCLDPANGKVDFEFPFRSRKYESVNASCPVVIGNSVFISATYRAGSALIDIKPDFTHAVKWTMHDREKNFEDDAMGLHWNTAVYLDGYLYAFDGRNEPDASLVCVNAKTGKVVWREEPSWEEEIVFNGEKQKIELSTLRGSLLHVDGRFLCLGELGHLLWLDLTPKGYREIDRTRLFLAREAWAMPIVSRGLLYITQNTRDVLAGTSPRLICYDLRANE